MSSIGPVSEAQRDRLHVQGCQNELDRQKRAGLADFNNVLSKNTRRSYDQVEALWNVICRPLPALGPLTDESAKKWCAECRWPDTNFVTEPKVRKFFTEVVFLRRVLPSKKTIASVSKRRKKTGPGELPPVVPGPDDLLFGQEYGMSYEALVEFMEADRVDMNRDSVEEPELGGGEGEFEDPLEGKQIKYSTAYNKYLSAITRLHQFQKAQGLAVPNTFRDASLTGTLKLMGRQKDEESRARFDDRGAKGLNSSYTPEEFLSLACYVLADGQTPQAEVGFS